MKKRIVITGGSGHVGQILRKGLRRKGYDVEVFDRYRGWLLNLLRGRYLGRAESRKLVSYALHLNYRLSQIEDLLIQVRAIRPSGDDILDERTNLVRRFERSYAVIHLAGLAHPGIPGFSDDDYRRINYRGAINVFEAARAAGVPKFIFSSSVAVYGFSGGIAKGTRIDQFPILETNYCPKVEDGNTIYGALKSEIEDYLARACQDGETRAIALRLGAPGFQCKYPGYLGLSTSIENLVEGFDCALRSDWKFRFEAFNLLDTEVGRESGVDVQAVLREHWPLVPNFTTGNSMPYSTEKLSTVLGYQPVSKGAYFDERITNVKKFWKEEEDRHHMAKRLRLATEELSAIVPAGQTVILVDDCQWGYDILRDRRVIPFLERDGQYYGAAPDDDTAIQEFNRLWRSGAQFIAFASPAFWWRDCYTSFLSYLSSEFRCVLENERLMVFDLRS